MSYSQLDDEALVLQFFKGKKDGFFVDIGAGDGVHDSNTRALWEMGWSGVLIEAHPSNFSALMLNYRTSTRTTLICAAICSQDGITDLYQFEGHSGWHSLDPAASRIMGAPATVIPVLGVRLETLKLAPRPDFLSVDTEGKDAEIIETMPRNFRPRLILAEIDKGNAFDRINRELWRRNYSLCWRNVANAAWSRKD